MDKAPISAPPHGPASVRSVVETLMSLASNGHILPFAYPVLFFSVRRRQPGSKICKQLTLLFASVSSFCLSCFSSGLPFILQRVTVIEAEILWKHNRGWKHLCRKNLGQNLSFELRNLSSLSQLVFDTQLSATPRLNPKSHFIFGYLGTVIHSPVNACTTILMSLVIRGI